MKTNFKLHLSAGKDALRPAMTFILLTQKEFVATDAHIMSIVPNNRILEDDSIALIPSNGLLIEAKMWKTIYNANHISLSLDGNKYFITGMFNNKPDITYELQKNDDDYNFPNWEQVIPNNSPSEDVSFVGINHKLLNNLGQALDLENFKLYFNGQNKPIVCKPAINYVQDYINENQYGIIMPYRIN